MKRLIFISIILILTKQIYASTSSSYLISQLAFKNYDYATSLSDFDLNRSYYSNTELLDKIIAAVITEDLSQANKIANKLIEKDKDNQEAYIVKLVYLYVNKEIKKIKKLYKEKQNKNELIDFIFFNNNKLKDKSTISNSLIDIVTSSFSNVNQLH